MVPKRPRAIRALISGRISFRTDVAFVSGTGLKDSRLKERLSSLTGILLTRQLDEKEKEFDDKLKKCFNLADEIVNEYSELLTTQLENQKIYFESLLREVEEEAEREISEAIEKAASGNQKLQKMQAKLDKCDQEKSFFDEINKSLLKNQDILKASIVEFEEREKRTLKLKDDKIRELEEQLGNLMVCLEPVILWNSCHNQMKSRMAVSCQCK